MLPRVALPSTLYNFDIELADADRGVYETLALRIARHPSESGAYLLTRLLAYCLELTEGLAFSKGGLSDPDEPALSVRDLTGRIVSWIEVGTPDAARLHRASKASPRVAVYTHADPERLLRAWSAEKIHRAEQLELVSFERPLLDALEARLDRRMPFALMVTGGQLYVTVGGQVIEGTVHRHALDTA
jgi:uncharacterized protein YaeQ